jgi:hypothetical protein
MCRLLIPLIAMLMPLIGCSSTPQYANPGRPGSGEADYKNDLAECRKQNSTIVTSSGYDDRSEVRVDEAKAQSCMTQRGWRAVSR